MTASLPYPIDPSLDLVLEREVEISPTLVWDAWTKPEHVKEWFTPAPWTTVECEIDLQPGGLFRTVMRSPEGQDHPNTGCYLEVVPQQKLAWTDALQPGYRPAKQSFMTGVILLEPNGTGTKYTAIAIHKDQKDRESHEKMGFMDGWGTALDQLVSYMKSQ